MKITDVKKINKEDSQELKDFDEIICVYQDKNRENRQAISINSDVKIETLLLCALRLNQAISKITNIPYSEYLKMMKNVPDFSSRVGNLDLSDEQLQKIIEKDVKGR